MNITLADDTAIDALAAEHYGIANATAGLTAIYSANPRLARTGVILPRGTTIILPDLPDADAAAIRLWD